MGERAGGRGNEGKKKESDDKEENPSTNAKAQTGLFSGGIFTSLQSGIQKYLGMGKYDF